ncbi:MAG: hypothetical protein SVM86_02710, partial [Candidatus Cloacimonadota bacterium]|nr:hypothetical protein [Candidatus Cloacimonadota bacterium]
IQLLKKIKYMLYNQKYTIEGARKKLKDQQKNKEQIHLDFVRDNKEIKENIIRELKELRRIIKSPAGNSEGSS